MAPNHHSPPNLPPSPQSTLTQPPANKAPPFIPRGNKRIQFQDTDDDEEASAPPQFMKKRTAIKVTMIGPSVMSKKCHIDQSLQDTVNVGASNTAKGKGKAASKPKTSKS